MALPKENFSKKQENEYLLTEYKAAQEMAIYYGKIFWTVGSIFYPVTLAGFAYGISQNLEFFHSLFLGIFLISLQIFILLFYRRIHWLSRIQFLRCQEIEIQLGFRQHRYHRILGDKLRPNKEKNDDQQLDIKLDDIEKNNQVYIAGEMVTPQKFGSPSITGSISFGLIILIIAWVIFQSKIQCGHEFLKFLGCP